MKERKRRRKGGRDGERERKNEKLFRTELFYRTKVICKFGLD